MTENEKPQNDEAVEEKATKTETPEAAGREAAAPVEAEAKAGESAEEAKTEAAESAPAEETAPSETDEEQKDAVEYLLKEVKTEEGSVQRYCVEVAPEIMDGKMKELLENLKKTVIVDGFRRGKAPLRLMKARFGKEAQNDAVNDMAANITDQIVKKEELEVLGEPSLSDSKVEEGKPVRLEIDIEVQPKIDAEGYTGEKYEVQVASPTDELVEKQIEQIRQANATFEEVEDKKKKYAKGDGATLDVEVVDKSGKRMEPLCQEGVFMRDPSMEMMPEVAEELVGKKAGDTFTKEVERKSKDKKGEETATTDTFTVTVKEIKERKAPELDDEFAKDLGDFETMDDLRSRIREDLTEQADRQKRQRVMDQVFTNLIEKNPFDAPKSVVAAQEYQTIMRDTQQMQSMGMDLSSMGMSTGDYLQSARSNAERYVKINFLVNSIAKKEKLEASDEDVDKEIERLAKAEGRKPLAIRARLEKEKRLDSMRRELVVDKVEKFILDNNTITVVEPEEPKKEPKKTKAKTKAKPKTESKAKAEPKAKAKPKAANKKDKTEESDK